MIDIYMIMIYAVNNILVQRRFINDKDNRGNAQ